MLAAQITGCNNNIPSTVPPHLADQRLPHHHPISNKATPCKAQAATTPSQRHRCHTVQSTSCSNTIPSTPMPHRAEHRLQHRADHSWSNTIPSTPMPHRAEHRLQHRADHNWSNTINTNATPCRAQAATTLTHQHQCHTVQSTGCSNTMPSTLMPHRAEHKLQQHLAATRHRAERLESRGGRQRALAASAEPRVPRRCEASGPGLWPVGRCGGQPGLWPVMRRGGLWRWVAAVVNLAFGR